MTGSTTWWWTSRFFQCASPLSSPPRWWRKSPGSGSSARATSLAGAFHVGGATFEPLERVLEEAGLVVVDPDRRGDVHRGHEDEPLAHAALVDGVLDVVGDADERAPLGRLEREVGGVRGHGAA